MRVWNIPQDTHCYYLSFIVRMSSRVRWGL